MSKIPVIGKIGTIGSIEPWEHEPHEPFVPTRGKARKAVVVKDPNLRRIEKLVGRERAEEVAKLMEVYPAEGTLPELLTMAWLDKRYILYDYQSAVMGGRRELGGAVVDFVIYGLGEGVACWRCQGEYWHSLSTRPRADADQKDRLLRAWWRGNKITKVVDLWEGDIYREFPSVFLNAELGISSSSSFFRGTN